MAWVIANTLGVFLALLIATALIPFVGILMAFLLGVEKPILLFTLTAVLVGVIAAAVLSLAQWREIRHIVPEVSAWAWTAATILGSFLPLVLVFASEIMTGRVAQDARGGASFGFSPAFFLCAACYGALLSGLLGLAQWAVLQAHVRESAWWVLATALAGAIALPLTLLALSYAQAQTEYWKFWIVAVLSLTMIGGACSAITGVVLEQFSESHERPSVPPHG